MCTQSEHTIPPSYIHRRRRRFAIVSCSMAGCHIDASASHPLDSASASKRLTSAYCSPIASCPLTPHLPFPVCLLKASPPVCLLFASWLSRRPCCCSVAESALQLCLNLFLASWLSQLATPHLSHRRRLSSSGRVTATGCVVARCRMEMGIDASPVSIWGSPLPYGDSSQMDPRYHTGIPIWERGLPYPHMGTGITVSIWGLKNL